MALTLFRKKTQSTNEILDVSRVLKPAQVPSVIDRNGRNDDPQSGDNENSVRATAAMAAAARVAEELSLRDDSLGASLDPETADEDMARARQLAGPRQVPWQRNASAKITASAESEAPCEIVDAAEDVLNEDKNSPEEQAANDIPALMAMSGALATDASPNKTPAPQKQLLPERAEPSSALPKPAKAPLLERLTPFALWVSASLVLASIVYAAIVGGVSLGVVGLFAGGIFIFATILLFATLTGAYSPLLLAGILLRRPTVNKKEAQSLAGRDVLAALGLAETLLDADVDSRLVTTREGVVVYANEQYMRIARLAGVVGITGLPPRIDRLFSQASGESSKMFRLARAARSGHEADEIITQTMGSHEDGAPQRRRFEVSVRPMADKGQHIAWRLREMPVETTRDTFRKAYEAYPRPVLALERSGNISWLNTAAKDLLGVGSVRDVSFSDLLLGEAKDIVEGLWEDEPEEIEGRVRAKSSDTGNLSVVFTAFTRAGVGEGFVCVEMLPKSVLSTDRQGSDASDLTDAPIGVAIVEGDVASDAKISSVNRLLAESLGAKPGMRLADVLSAESMRDLVAAMRAKGSNKALTRPVDVVVGEGADSQNLRLLARPIKRRRGAYGPRQMVLYAIDVSFQKRMEEDYAHDKRLKAIGKIAGSVAHDFNNFLQAMMGATEFLMRRHPAGDPSYPDLVSIRENAQRARNLTSNLLAFSRKQTLQQEVVSVTELLSDFTPFVQRYVTEKVKVVVDHGRQVGCVKADLSQLELAIMNLAVNARDAMDKGGTLTISSKRVPAAEVESYGYQVLETIDHVLIEMADTGLGVPADIADKIFEPFFTTKSEGKGTGLGLSTVHGIVGQLGGRIFLHNRPGEGATFRIFLPALSEEEASTAFKSKNRKDDTTTEVDDLTGKGRILIVEDEDSVRNIVVRALGMCGYEIVEASDGDEALEIIEDSTEKFDVILSDIMMPEMDGPTLIQEAGDKLGNAKVIFMSGYAETAMRDKLAEIKEARYLQKPFTLKKVAAVVKEAMAE